MQFTITPKISDLVRSIRDSNSHVWSLLYDLPTCILYHFMKRCLIDEVILTNKIEGIAVTRQEVEAAYSASSTSIKLYDMVHEYMQLEGGSYIFLENCNDIRKVYDDCLLAEVQRENLDNVPDGNVFRKGRVNVCSAQGVIHQGAYPEEQICKRMNEVLQVLKDDSYDMLCRIAAFHYMLEEIHPFYDGNGRLGRFLCSYLLSQELAPIVAYRLSYTIYSRKVEYYRAFSSISEDWEQQDITSFVEIFLSIVDESMQNLIEGLTERHMRLETTKLKICKLSKDDSLLYELYLALVLFSLYSEHGANIDQLMQSSGIPGRIMLFQRLSLISDELLIKHRYENITYFSLDLNKLELGL